MIVKQAESPIYHRRKRTSLPGKGMESGAVNREKSFDQYLIEAFDGEVVKEGNHFGDVSALTRDNLIRLSRI
jgi:hypothetical protein